ncbi:MAG TPA: MFS transporter, partial [Acidobacteriaceae bacterium]|nr:MFS transporter [Acidobacteriaceae bacterium]
MTNQTATPNHEALNPVINDVRPPVGHLSAVWASFFGWTLDAFDFFLVVFCLTTIGREFGESDARMALSLTATLAFRPIGALLFGILADRYGRRMPLIVNVLFYSVAGAFTGLVHSYLAFMVLRALFGIGMGGQWGIGASLAMEKVPAKRRGMLSGLLQQGYAAGSLFAAICYLLLLRKWGWRPLFFVGCIPALFLVVFIYQRVKESEVWERSSGRNWRNLTREFGSHWRLFLYLTIFMMMMLFASHGTQDMYPTFLQRQ